MMKKGKMRFLKYILAFVLFGFSSAKVSAQELNCTVSIINPTVQLTNKEPILNMQNAIKEFINNRHWTNESFSVNERIECNILINLTSVNLSTSEYSGSIQITASRPAYGTTYSSSTINYIDKNFTVKYLTNQQMDYVEGTYTSELSAMLTYYTYILLGFDFDTYSELGGTPYFNKAMNMVNAAQSSSAGGWSAMEKDERNRYYLATELTSDRYVPLRKAIYKYYRLGLDVMVDDSKKGLDNIIESLTDMKAGLQQLGTGVNGSMIAKLFFESKMNELIDLISTVGTTDQRCKARDLLMQLDITNANRYSDRIKC